LFALGKRNDLVHLLVDAAGLVHDGQGVVQPLQPLRHGRQDLKRRTAGQHREGVGVDLDAGLQVGVELHHAGRLPVAEGGPPLVGGHHDDAGPLGTGQQLIQR
jgi:hypothetical protein